MRRFIISTIKFYKRNLSVYNLPSCKYYPCCSSYAIDAIEKNGILRGLAKAAWRVLRCNPFSRGGYDPA